MIFFICFFLTIFTRNGFSAKTKVFPENNLRAKRNLREVIFEKGVSRSRVFKDFTIANDIKDISFKYMFCSKELLQESYTTEKGFTTDFIDDAIQGFCTEKDSLRLLEMIEMSYRSDMNNLGQKRSFPRITEFIPNCYDFYRCLCLVDAEENHPESHPGLYCVSVIFKDSNHANFRLLQPLLENSLRFKPKKKIKFLGDKQNLIDMILNKGLIKSSLLKNFILGNNKESISFSFYFQSVEDSVYSLSHTFITDEVINGILDFPENENYHEFFQKEASRLVEKDYCAEYNILYSQAVHHLVKNRFIDLRIEGLMEVVINNKHAEDNLMNGQTMGRGLYFIFAAFVVDPYHPERLLEIYVPHHTVPHVLQFSNYEPFRSQLINEIQSSGVTQSKIFKEFIEINSPENIAFQYTFIPKNTGEDIFPCGTTNCPSADDFVSGNFDESHRKFLRKELYYNYLQAFEIRKVFGEGKKRNVRLGFLPTVGEFLSKNVITTGILTRGGKDLEDEQGIYLVLVFRKTLDREVEYPHARKLKNKPETWTPNHIPLMYRIFPNQQLLDTEDKRIRDEAFGKTMVETSVAEKGNIGDR